MLFKKKVFSIFLQQAYSGYKVRKNSLLQIKFEVLNLIQLIF